MPHSEQALTTEAVCAALMAAGMLTVEQTQTIRAQEEAISSRVEERRQQQRGAASTLSPADQATIIDVIAYLDLPRADDPLRRLEEDDVYQTLARTWGIPFIKIDPLKLDLNLVTSTIPHTFARRNLVLPIAIEDGKLVVATPNPFREQVFQDIAQVCQRAVRPVVTSRTDLVKLIGEFFGFKRSIAAAEHAFDVPGMDLGNLEQLVRLRTGEDLPPSDQHIVHAVDHLFGYAMDQRASDIHIEPKRDKSLVRIRIDGLLHTIYELPGSLHSALVSRIKHLARLDMAEKRRPQDGRIKLDKGGLEVEVRVSSLPVAFGEKVVARVMDPEVLFQDLETLGFTPAELIRFQNFVNLPHGLILVCGPTGSGKTTTLYSTLAYLSSPEINITTIEDPIEMVHPEFNQIAVQPAIDITFGSILRHVLRQDPDVIMVGELRDQETAQNAIQAALTGHLVLSTLHTNDAAGAVGRLHQLGVPDYLIQATLVGVLAQRLVRTICPSCRESFVTDPADLRMAGLYLASEDPVTLHRGKGCLKCRGTGYRGRAGIFEVLPVSEAIRRQITPQAEAEAIRDVACREGMTTLRESGVAKLLSGATTYQEVLRVTWEQV